MKHDFARPVPRATRPDAEVGNQIHLLKSASHLHATYQIRLLLFRAIQEGKTLVLNVRQQCEFYDDLSSLISENPAHIQIVRR